MDILHLRNTGFRIKSKGCLSEMKTTPPSNGGEPNREADRTREGEQRLDPSQRGSNNVKRA